MLNLLLNSVEKYFGDNLQPYLVKLCRALLSTTYFGLFRIGEVTYSTHVLRAINVNIGHNKNKLMFVLHSSKTHDKSQKPQIVKIAELASNSLGLSFNNCPFRLMREFLQVRGRYRNEEEAFFVFSDKSPVYPAHFRNMLKKLIKFNLMDSD